MLMRFERFDPFRELDRSLEQLTTPTARTFPLDAFRRGDQFIVHFDLPGVDPAGIDLTVERNVLTVTAQRQADRREGDQPVVAERPYGTFSRQLFLGESLDPDGVRANYEAGVLTLTIPVAQQAKPRKLQVTSGDAGRTEVIEGSATRTGNGSGNGSGTGSGQEQQARVAAG